MLHELVTASMSNSSRTQKKIHIKANKFIIKESFFIFLTKVLVSMDLHLGINSGNYVKM